MSRIAKNSINISDNVTCKFENGNFYAKGKLGEMTLSVDDLFTVDSEGTRNGSIRITKAKYVKDGTMSRRVGSMLDDCTNVHSEDDLEQAGYRWRRT